MSTREPSVIKLTDDELETRLGQSACAATVAAYRTFAAQLAEKAGHAFVAKDEGLARAYRALHEETVAVLKRHEIDLTRYIQRMTSRNTGDAF